MNISRLAPSPTGAQHLGNARTHLVAFWAARSRGLPLGLRIEDLDTPRVKTYAWAELMTDLRWLGIDWDVGPPADAELRRDSPFLQTNRRDRYQATLERLLRCNRVYPCTCTRRDIANAASAPHGSDGLIRYPGTCSHWSVGDPMPETGTYCWRFRCDDSVDQFVDLVLGRQICATSKRLGDFPLTRKGGEFAYQLAVVVDDHAMQVGQVVRGDDLVESTFWQLQLYRALAFTPPEFAHLPLVIGPDGRRLAKRHGDTRLAFFRDAGVDPGRVIRWAAESIGLVNRPAPGESFLPGRDRTKADFGRLEHRDVIEQFEWRKINKHPTVVVQNDFL